MRAMLLILAQDLRRRSKDSTLLVFAIVLPLGMAFMFDLVIGGSEGPVAARYGAVGASPSPRRPRSRPSSPSPPSRRRAIWSNAAAWTRCS
ncbi:hypothetical protein [Nonomuraea recticatena]|uniref:hypothetical protein n=1 Tax=Nonomuraea recticatena TaxID=46178 RepID=UPI00360893C7